jgi:hypothetical protein
LRQALFDRYLQQVFFAKVGAGTAKFCIILGIFALCKAKDSWWSRSRIIYLPTLESREGNNTANAKIQIFSLQILFVACVSFLGKTPNLQSCFSPS